MTGLARRGLLSLGGAAISAVANFLVIVVVARGFDQVTAGYLFSTTSFFVIAESLCALGTATGMVYFIARVRSLGKAHATRRLILMATRPVFVVSVVVAVAMFLSAPLVAGHLSSNGTADDEAVLFIRIAALFLPFATLFQLFVAASQGFHTMTPTVVLEKVGRPVLQLGGLALASALGLAWLLPVAWCGPYLLGVAIMAWWLVRLVRRDPAPSADDPPVVGRREFWRYTAPRGIASAAQLSLQRLDILLVAFLIGPGEAAVYTAATRFVVVGQLGSQAVALAVQPKFAQLLAQDDRSSASRVYRTTTAWVMAVTWPVHLLVAVLAPVVMEVFGPGYGRAWPVVVVLAGAMLFATSCGMVTMLLVMAGKTSWNLMNVGVALVLNVTLNLVLIPQIGILGAAFAWAAAIVVSNALPLVQVKRLLALDPFGRGSVLVAALAVLCFAAIPALGWFFDGSTIVLVVLVAAGAMLYVVGLWRLRRTLDLDDLVVSLRRRRVGTRPR
ncbi:oligosaccharide flippase family protein [Isoptericola jiangsuensis]|uniref:oligosaccharide flippase family protein n=1 Tax=Isoptericola jiangsuensis TaxID=548579 RepID=UPI003AAC743F